MKNFKLSFKNNQLVYFGFLLASVLIYLPSLGGYFLHTDDWFWSYWGGFSCSAVVHWILPIGRPLAGFIYCILPLVTKFSAMWVFRLLNVLTISGVGFLLWKWMTRWKVDGAVAFLVTLLIVTLPAFHVFASYISTIPHCLALVPSLLAAFCVDEAFSDVCLLKRRVLLLVGAVSLLLMALTLNQASALFYVGVLLVPVLMSDGVEFFKLWPQRLLRFGGVLLIAVGVYYLCFRISAVLFAFRGVGKYDGRNFVTNYWGRVRWFFENPFYEASNLWSINPSRLLFVTVLVSMMGVILWDFRKEVSKRETVGKYLVALALFPAGYGISLVSSDPSKEYRTYAVLGSSFVFFLFIGIYSIVVRHYSQKVLQRVIILLSLLSIVASIVANKTVAEYFVLSDSSEFRFVKNEIRNYLSTGKELKAIHVIVAQGAIAAPRQRNEIGEPTIRHTPNIEPLIWAALEEQGFMTRPKVTTGNSLEDHNWVELVFDHNTIDLRQDSYAPSSDGVLIVDVSKFRFI